MAERESAVLRLNCYREAQENIPLAFELCVMTTASASMHRVTVPKPLCWAMVAGSAIFILQVRLWLVWGLGPLPGLVALLLGLAAFVGAGTGRLGGAFPVARRLGRVPCRRWASRRRLRNPLRGNRDR